MSVDTTATHQPLHDPGKDGGGWTPPLDLALSLARAALAEHGATNIHDDHAMIRAAIHLEIRLRDLVAALDKEAGR